MPARMHFVPQTGLRPSRPGALRWVPGRGRYGEGDDEGGAAPEFGT